MEAFRQNPFRSIVSWSAVQDWFANLLAHGLFQRFPNLRMASIETGSDWVFHLFDKLKKSYSQTPHALPRGPARDVQRHVWVSPYYEDDLAGLRDLARRRPHADGIRLPARRGPRRAEHLHQGPRELRLHARGLAAGDARQRVRSSRSADLRDHARLAVGGHLQDGPRHAHRPGRAVRAARGRRARRAHARVRQPTAGSIIRAAARRGRAHGRPPVRDLPRPRVHVRVDPAADRRGRRRAARPLRRRARRPRRHRRAEHRRVRARRSGRRPRSAR